MSRDPLSVVFGAYTSTEPLKIDMEPYASNTAQRSDSVPPRAVPVLTETAVLNERAAGGSGSHSGV